MNRPATKWLAGIAGVALAILAVKLVFTPIVMPLDNKTLEKFQETNSKIFAQLLEQSNGMSYAEMSAESFRLAIKAIGYHPDKTLLVWLSPEFHAKITAGDPKLVTDQLRLTDSLIKTALGDGSTDEEFARIMAQYSSEVRDAARLRRGL